MRSAMDDYSNPQAASVQIEDLASTDPVLLACTHGAAYRGDGASALRALAKALRSERLDDSNTLTRFRKPVRNGLEIGEGHSFELGRLAVEQSCDTPLDGLFDRHPEFVGPNAEHARLSGEAFDRFPSFCELRDHRRAARLVVERPTAVGLAVEGERAHARV